MRENGDSVESSSTAPRALSNGSSTSPLHKAALSNIVNGRLPTSTTTNGSSHEPPNSNGIHSPVRKSPPPTYFGHDREEMTRILIQSLDDLGYNGAAAALSHESGIDLETSAVAAFRNAVLHGDWADAEVLLFGREHYHSGTENGSGTNLRGLTLREDADKRQMLFEMRQQKFLELLEERDLGSALMVLRQELATLNYDSGSLPALSSLMMCQSAEDLRNQAGWDGAHGQSRQRLLSSLSLSISPSVMIPEHRLAKLLQQVKKNQISNCLYHNTAVSPSLYSDHICDRSQFPTTTALELLEHTDEVWFLEFSHDGTRLATAGKDRTLLIYSTSDFSTIHKLEGHSQGVGQFAWSPDDSRIISGSQDNTARVWDTKSGRCLMTLDHHNEPVSAIVWHPDGKTFVTAALDINAPLCLWNLDGELLYAWKAGWRVQDCAISPDAQRLVAVSGENEIYTFDFVTKEKLYNKTVKAEKLTCINVSKDSKYILINRSDNEVQMLEIDTATVVQRYSGQKQGHYVIRSIFGGADENFVVSGSEDAHVYIWHKENGSLLEKLPAHQPGAVNSVAWNPKDPCMFASAGDDFKVRIWSQDFEPTDRWRQNSNGFHR